jgi:ATP-dependent DNA helicase DinG
MTTYSDIVTQTKEIFSADGILAHKLPNYEARNGQQEMALAVAQTLSSEDMLNRKGTGMKLAVEAGTGIGKTLAYLVPAALSGQKIIISTGTLNLQDQILNKEIPFIQEHIVPDLSALAMKGRQNYLCLYRWRQFIASSRPTLFTDTPLDEISNWLKTTKTGDRAELDWLPDNTSLWHELSATASQCLGMNCPDSSICYLNRLRKKAARVQLLIVNHHLFFSDLSLRRFGFAEVLPRYESVIFDEAHHIENIATRYFGISFSHYQLIDLIKDTLTLADDTPGDKNLDKLRKAARKTTSQAEGFLNLFPEEKGRFPLKKAFKHDDWEKELTALQDALSHFAEQLDSRSKTNDSWNSLVRRTDELMSNLFIIVNEKQSSYVHWYERREKTVSLSASPIEVATELQDCLYGEVKAAVFTSATLTTGDTFTYFFEHLGLPVETESIRLSSPFDYKNKSNLFIPDNSFPEPSHPEFMAQLEENVEEILLASRGRALVLCTSIKAMRALYDFLDGRLPYPVYRQGNAPRHILLEQFGHDTHSVLLAVASFWEGINVPGETLSCVIIDKLPFEVPSDPVIMARIDKIKNDGGNPFIDFQVPRAILSLRQGLGRLMRSASDEGLLAIMDVRLFKKHYGRIFRKSLPDSPVIRTMKEVRTFFKFL